MSKQVIRDLHTLVAATHFEKPSSKDVISGISSNPADYTSTPFDDDDDKMHEVRAQVALPEGAWFNTRYINNRAGAPGNKGEYYTVYWPTIDDVPVDQVSSGSSTKSALVAAPCPPFCNDESAI